MARTRYIKPDFFTDEDIADLPLEARLFFIGLWCHADRKGRLEDRPKFFKVAILPFDEFDIEAIIGLLALAEKPFIRHYEVDGKRYIQIINFEKHQRPHHTERDSTIPDPKKGITVKERLDNGYLTVRQRSAPLYSSNGDGDGDGERKGEGEVHEDKREREDKAAAPLPFSEQGQAEPEAEQTAAHPSPASPGKPEAEQKTLAPRQYHPEADILAIATAFCELRGMSFVSDTTRGIYIKQKGMFYPAKDLLALNGGDVERTKICLKDLAEHYEGKGTVDWKWSFILEDFPEWDEARRKWEEQHVGS